MSATIVIGADRSGAPVRIDVEELLATRLLVQGNSGSGKSHLLRRLLEQSASIVQQVVIDPEGDFVTLADAFGHVVVDGSAYDAAEIAKLAARIRKHRASVILTLDGLDELVINGAGSALIALGDGTMRIVDMRRASGSQRTPKQVKVHAAAFSVDGDHIVVDFYDGDHDEHRARIAKVAERHDQRSTPPLPGPASALALRADPERLYRGTPTGQVIEVNGGQLMA